MAGRIARAIVSAREQSRIETTLELARIVAAAYPAKRRALARNHPATKTFQALRLEVNQELAEVEKFLERVVDYLRPGGRIAVISFHSLEDRIVKRAFRKESSGCLCPREYPVCQCGHQKKLVLPFRKPLVPGEEEMRANSRSRSAKLRVAERIAGEGA
jgi:16S rRNA (cytosine1402-N4)-methyltransferase